jgi:transcriptional regulator with XRE-family HTH domain
VSNWESDRNEPPLNVLTTLRTKYGIDLNWLITGDSQSIDFKNVFDLAFEYAVSVDKGIEKLQTTIETFIISDIVDRLVLIYDKPISSLKLNEKIKKVILGMGKGKFLLVFDEMLAKLHDLPDALSSKEKIENIISGEVLNKILSKPLYGEIEQSIFSLWSDSLTEEECEFMVSNSKKFRSYLSKFILAASSLTSVDVKINRAITSSII